MSRTCMYGSTTNAAVATASATTAPAASLTSFSMRESLLGWVLLPLLPEQRRTRAGGAEAQRHGQEVADEHDVAQHHQRAADAAPLEIGHGERDRFHERPRRV